MSASAVNAVLVAGVGNIFMSDDGFGVEVVRRLAERELPAGVELVDVGIRGMHLAYQLLDGYSALVLVDTTARGGEPGQLYLLEHDLSQIRAIDEDDVDNLAVPDAHDMSPDTVLALLGSLATASGQEPTAGLRRVLVVGCEPASTEDGIGLTDPVAASVDRAATAVNRVVAELLAELAPTTADDHAELRGAVHVPRHTG
jgi:hydrogenase maturation protease